ncbi:questin oxidase family protein [Paucibacter sp. APW11]|uniref:Questin oxidase family protein n=1 Tax=Roseateles aquae TaxID=3077235 RepID=A0ABU3PCV4_9BURK|nr:questin oxidase family protein [Paucibacter sp. APW11]MDT9000416.1 questin oxidase family protein [Paucibacter sp. APW11]
MTTMTTLTHSPVSDHDIHGSAARDVADAASTADLERLLGEALRFAPAYEEAMSNHLPMALHAAWELGASPQRLQALVEHEAVKLDAAPAAATVLPAAMAEPQGWLAWRGQQAAYPLLLGYFQRALAGAPADEVLRAHLPALLPGLHSFAFHGLIRCAHADESHRAGASTAELAAALATWAAWFELLPPGQAVDAAERLPLPAWGEQLRLQTAGWRCELGMISWRMQAASQTALYAGLAERLAPAPTLAQRRDELISFALDAYLHSRNFTLLHLITGLRALRVLQGLLGDDLDQRSAQALLARAAVSGWMAGRVQWQAAPTLPDPDRLAWPSLHAAALAQHDEHAIKLVHACWQEDGLRPDPRWRQAAALVLG